MTNPTADHPHTDPGDGRTECPTCGKFVFRVIHSCKGVPVTAAAQARRDAAAQATPTDDRCTDPNPHGPHEHYGEPASIRRDCPGRDATTPYTDADVDLVARVSYEDFYGQGSWESARPHRKRYWGESAQAVLTALATAGRLAPVDTAPAEESHRAH